jgi:hypothetical protein
MLRKRWLVVFPLGVIQNRFYSQDGLTFDTGGRSIG